MGNAFMYTVTFRSYDMEVTGFARGNSQEEAIQKFIKTAIRGAVKHEEHLKDRTANYYDDRFEIDLPYFCAFEVADGDITEQEAVEKYTEQYGYDFTAISLPFYAEQISTEEVYVLGTYKKYNQDKKQWDYLDKYFTDKGRII